LDAYNECKWSWPAAWGIVLLLAVEFRIVRNLSLIRANLPLACDEVIGKSSENSMNGRDD
jgi:hypothetical protein